MVRRDRIPPYPWAVNPKVKFTQHPSHGRRELIEGGGTKQTTVTMMRRRRTDATAPLQRSRWARPILCARVCALPSCLLFGFIWNLASLSVYHRSIDRVPILPGPPLLTHCCTKTLTSNHRPRHFLGLRRPAASISPVPASWCAQRFRTGATMPDLRSNSDCCHRLGCSVFLVVSWILFCGDQCGCGC